MGRLDGKVALITGAGRGIGAAIARLFAREGARVVVADIRDADGEQVAAEIRARQGAAVYVHLDVAREPEWIAAIEATERRDGKLNVLVNNAGVFVRSGIEDTTEADWNFIMDVNAKGVMFGMKHAAPAMRRAGGGSIVNISSTSGIIGMGSPAYGASKAAVRIMSKTAAVKLAGDKIRCNSLHPGLIDTPLRRELNAGLSAAQVAESLKGVPLGRVATEDEIAYGVLYLASDESSYVTGTELVIDGGHTAQ